MIRLIFFFLAITLCNCNETDLPEEKVSTINPVLPDKPNILWLVAEDLGNYLPPFGDSTVKTPHLSRLASEGVCYDRFFTAAPVCSPARASISLGMYPSGIAANHMRTGPWYSHDLSQEQVDKYSENSLPDGIQAYEAMPPAEARMISERLRAKGYYCTNNAKQDYQFRRPLTSWDESSRTAHWRNRSSNQPFYAVFNFEVTHESRIWNKANDPLLVDSQLVVPIPPYLPDTEVGRRDVRRMYSNIIEMDQQVGEILAQLEADGLLESTLIFWYTDHGGPLPRQKRLLYDSGLHVPLIVRFPDGSHAGERSDQMLSFIDLAPTLLSITGEDPPDHMDGRAFLGDFAESEHRTYVHAAADRFDESYDRNRAVRDTRYKYIRYDNPEKPMFLHVDYRDQQPIMRELYRLRDEGLMTPDQLLWFREKKPDFEFFDTWEDPHELNNLANDPAYQDKISDLSAECDRWLNEIDDLEGIPETELLKKIWPNNTQPTTSAADPVVKEGRVLLSSKTEGASLGYRLSSDNETPWSVYIEPIELQSGQKVYLLSHRIGYLPAKTTFVMP